MSDTQASAARFNRGVAIAMVVLIALAAAGVFGWRWWSGRAEPVAATTTAAQDPQGPHAEAVELMIAHRYPEAIAAVERALALDPAMPGLQAIRGDAWLLLGDAEKAVAAYRAEPETLARLTGLAMGEYRLGHVELAQEALDALIAAGGAATLYRQAQVRAQWGDADLALAALERARAAGDSGLVQLPDDPMLDPLRADPRFKSLAAGLKTAA